MFNINTIIFVIVIGVSLQAEDPIIGLPEGSIQGRMAETVERWYYVFEKIPYAAPPVGDLRFKDPQPVEAWDGILNTTYLDVSCIQSGRMSMEGSEDCLFLNVYTPKLGLTEDWEPMAVMVYIHGGGFTGGWSLDYPPDLFVNNDIVLVTINYRLGIYGFLSTQDDVIPGNAGLKDQLAAFQWVQKNIELFGGDAGRVTIFGQSAGSGSCAYHLLNSESEGLFSRVILESGSFLSQGMFQREPRKIAFTVAAYLDPSFEESNDSQALLELFQIAEPDDLSDAVEQYIMSGREDWDNIAGQGGTWAPSIERDNPTAIFTDKMYQLLEAGKILAIPVMMGFNSEESLLENREPKEVEDALKTIDDHLEYLVPIDMGISDVDKKIEMGTKIRDIYTNAEVFVDHLGAGIRYASDNKITRPVRKHAEIYSQFTTIYFYQFSYDGEIGGVDVHYEDGAGSVGHTEELNYLFCSGDTCTSDNWPEADLVTRRRLIKLWTDFAKYANPTPLPSELLQNITWPPLSLDDGEFVYLNIGENLVVDINPKEESYSGWVALYDTLDFGDFDTY